jgi:hypothetical protein
VKRAATAHAAAALFHFITHREIHTMSNKELTVTEIRPPRTGSPDLTPVKSNLYAKKIGGGGTA